MKPEYAVHYEGLLVESMRAAFPEFRHMDADAQRTLGGLPYYGPGHLTGFRRVAEWITFLIVFRVPPDSDEFEAVFCWSESGRFGKKLPLTDYGLFSPETLRLPQACAHIQALSDEVGDSPSERVFRWPFWKPSASLDDQAAWLEETIAEERRSIVPEEAARRVGEAVAKAVRDIQRCAIPWFLQRMRTHEVTP